MRPQALILLIGCDVAQLRLSLEFLHELGDPFGQLSRVTTLQAVLKLRAADAVLYRQVLNGLHEEADSLHLGHMRLDPTKYLACGDPPFLYRLQVNLNPARVDGGIRSIHADE